MTLVEEAERARRDSVRVDALATLADAWDPLLHREEFLRALAKAYRIGYANGRSDLTNAKMAELTEAVMKGKP